MKKREKSFVTVEVDEKAPVEEQVKNLSTAVVMLAKVVKWLQKNLKENRDVINEHSEILWDVAEAVANLIEDFVGLDEDEECEESYCAWDWLVDLVKSDEEKESKKNDKIEELTVCPCCWNIE